MKTKHTSKIFALLLAILMVVAIIPFSAITAFAATPSSKVEINAEKTVPIKQTLDASTPFLVNGEASASGTLGTSGCTAYFDDATDTLTLNGYEGGSLLFDGDITVKLIGTNTINCTNQHNYCLKSASGNIVITSDAASSLVINGEDGFVKAYSGIVSESGSVTVSGKVNLSISIKNTISAYGSTAVGITAANGVEILDSSSLNITTECNHAGADSANGIYVTGTNKNVVFNTTGDVTIKTIGYNSYKQNIINNPNGTNTLTNVGTMTLYMYDPNGNATSATPDLIYDENSFAKRTIISTGNLDTYRSDVTFIYKATTDKTTITYSYGEFPSEDEYVLSNEYLVGETAVITAAPDINGLPFKEWEIVSGSPVYAEGTNAKSQTVKIVVGDEPVHIRARYDIFETQPTFTFNGDTVEFNGTTYKWGALNYALKPDLTPNNVMLIKEQGIIDDGNTEPVKSNYLIGDGRKFMDTGAYIAAAYADYTSVPAGNYRIAIKVLKGNETRYYYSDVFTVGYTTELKFVDNDGYDVADGYAGTAIDEINVSGAVSGGDENYTFSKESGPSWLNVSADGKITGTRPTTAQAVTTATIKVTDGASASKTITIAIGAVSMKTINAIDFTLSGYAIDERAYDTSVVVTTSGIDFHDNGDVNRRKFYDKATNTALGTYDTFAANTTYRIKVCYTVKSGYELGVAPTLTLGDATFVENVDKGGYYIATFELPQLNAAINNLTGITITTPPTKTAYVVGENFDKTGMVVTATYEDSSTAPITDYTITNGTALTAGQTTVTISYTENMITKTATVTITVHEHTYGDTFNGKDATNHWKECTATDCPDKEGSKKDVYSHSESTPATCIAKATCACGQEIGEFAAHSFAANAWNEEVPATCVATGTKAHKDCSVCEKHFAADGVTEIADLTIAIDTTNHDMATEWTKTAEGHYHSCKRTGCEYHDTLVAHTSSGSATETTPETCTVCGYVINPALAHTTHTPKTEWKSDADNHWHECTGCEGQQLDKAAHVDSDTNGKCDTCNADVPVAPPHTHTHGTTWKSDANNHWNECECGDKANVAAHADTNNDEKCDTCGYDMPASGTEPGTTPGTDDPNTPDDPDKKDGLGAGAIVAIVIGSVAVVGIGGFAIFWFVIKKKSWAELVTAIKELWAKFLSLFKKNK